MSIRDQYDYNWTLFMYTKKHGVENLGLRSTDQILRQKAETPGPHWTVVFWSDRLFVREHDTGALQVYIHKDLIG